MNRFIYTLALSLLLLAGGASAQSTVEIEQCGNATCTTDPTTPVGPFLDIVVDSTRFSTYLNHEEVYTGGDPYCGFSGVMDFYPADLARPPAPTADTFKVNGTYPGMDVFSLVSAGNGWTPGTDRRTAFLLDLYPNDGISSTWNSTPGFAEMQVDWDLVRTDAVQTVQVLNGAYSAQHREFCSNAYTDFTIGDLEVGYVAAASWVDTDSDGMPDQFDNCSIVGNTKGFGTNYATNQLDSDLDGYGNACDADYDGDGLVTSTDFGIFLAALQDVTQNPATDHDGDGDTTTIDFGTFLTYFQGTGLIGVSGLTCADPDPTNGPCTPQDL